MEAVTRRSTAEFSFWATGAEASIRSFARVAGIANGTVRARKIHVLTSVVPGAWVWYSPSYVCTEADPATELLDYIDKNHEFWSQVAIHRSQLEVFSAAIVNFRREDGMTGCYLPERLVTILAAVRASVDIDNILSEDSAEPG